MKTVPDDQIKEPGPCIDLHFRGGWLHHEAVYCEAFAFPRQAFKSQTQKGSAQEQENQTTSLP